MNMPAKQHSDAEVLEILIDLFRDHGYDGTSLSRIMDATGLVKASLYHRFAGGKAEMAQAVIDDIKRQFAEVLLAPLVEAGDPEQRLRRTAANLRRFYGSGRRACLLDTMTPNKENQPLQAQARPALRFWIDAFARFARECGFSADAARVRAEDAVAAIEGGLVLARISGNRSVFLRALGSLPNRLMGVLPRGTEGRAGKASKQGITAGTLTRSRSDLAHAPVDVEFDSGDIAGLGTGQEEGGGSNLLG